GSALRKLNELIDERKDNSTEGTMLQ
ncbi:MAG: translocation-enhancing protein TepA, partial [Bacillus mycoides]